MPAAGVCREAETDPLTGARIERAPFTVEPRRRRLRLRRRTVDEPPPRLPAAGRRASRLGRAAARRALGYAGLLGLAGCARRRSPIAVDEFFERVEARLLPEPAPDLDDEPLAVEVAVEVEQVRLDAALDAVEVRVRADRDRGAPVPCVQPA